MILNGRIFVASISCFIYLLSCDEQKEGQGKRQTEIQVQCLHYMPLLCNIVFHHNAQQIVSYCILSISSSSFPNFFSFTKLDKILACFNYNNTILFGQRGPRLWSFHLLPITSATWLIHRAYQRIYRSNKSLRCVQR